MEFWNEVIIDRSFKLLQALKGKIDFILIGGWAVYFLTGAIKSKDIDMIVSFETLSEMKKIFPVSKTEFLRKYTAEIEGTEIDIYVPYYSKLIVPVEDIMESVMVIEGFKIPEPEVLLLLKQQAEAERAHTIKGQKDRVDILALLLSGKVDFSRYNELVKELKLEEYKRRLKEILLRAKDEFEYLGIRERKKIKGLKKQIVSKLDLK